MDTDERTKTVHQGYLITPNYRMNQRQITEKFNTKLPKIEIIN